MQFFCIVSRLPAVFAGVFFLFFAQGVAARDVVLLHSKDRPTAWTESLCAGMSAGLGDGFSVHQEYLGGKNLDEDYFDEQFKLLAEKYSKKIPAQ